jgi:hypothetical protein
MEQEAGILRDKFIFHVFIFQNLQKNFILRLFATVFLGKKSLLKILYPFFINLKKLKFKNNHKIILNNKLLRVPSQIIYFL